MHFTEGLAKALERRMPTLVVGWKRRFPEFLYPGTSRDETSATVVSAAGEPILDLLDPRTWRAAGNAIRRFDADCAVLQWWHPAHTPVIRSLARQLRRAGIRTLLVCHNIEPHETNPLWRRMTRHALGSVDGLVVHAKSLHDEARSLVPTTPVIDAFMPTFDNVATVTGPSTAAEARQVRDRVGVGDRPLLLTFGYVRPYKGVEDAIASVAHTKCDPVLLVAGECWDEPERYVDAARAAGVADRVVFDFRYIPNDELAGLFGAADAIVLPYRDATQSAVAALAFAYDRPVVATAVGGLPEFVTEGVSGALAPAHDPQGLAAAIDRVVGAPHDWGPALGALRERYSWDRYVDLLVAKEPEGSADAVFQTAAGAEVDRAPLKRLKGALNRLLGRDRYLRLVSAGFAASFRIGLLRRNPVYANHYYVRHLVLPGDVVIDLGANLGYYAAEFARLVGPTGRVLGVEPVPFYRDVLVRRTRRYPHVTVLPYAIGESDGRLAMGIPGDAPHRHGLMKVLDRSEREALDEVVEVEARTPQALFGDLARIDFIKCDIEGYEVPVIPSMRALIARHRPAVQVETDGPNKRVLFGMFRSLDYDLFQVVGESLRPYRDPDDPLSGDLIALPDEHPLSRSVIDA